MLKYRFTYIICFALFFLLADNFAWGQLPRDDYLRSELRERSLSAEQREKWEKSIAGIDYSKTINEAEEEEGEDMISQGPDAPNRGDGGGWEIGGSWDLFFKLLFISLLVVGLGFILYHILLASFARPKEKKLKPVSMAINLEKIEENLHESDLDRFIQEAIEQEDYALAIRLYYLAIIKTMSLRKLIKWKRDKTNRDYLKELKQPALQKTFREATRVFERVWYGKALLDQDSFQQLRPGYEALIRQIEKTPSSLNAE